MTYRKNYCEEKGINTSKLNEAQRTLHYIAENMKMTKSISEEGYTHFQIAIKALEQEPKTGHWEYGYAFADGNYCKCSECKEIIKCTYPMHYCPNCGTKMVKPQESEDKE